MSRRAHFLLTFLFLGIGSLVTDAVPARRLKRSLTCTAEYSKIPKHTLCLTDDARVVKSGVSAKDKETIVKMHNDFRGKTNPPAADLAKLVWDDSLATVAEKWAKQCKMGHEANGEQRKILSYNVYVGQNVAGGYSRWTQAITAWHDEVKLYKYGQVPETYLGANGFAKIGHYTQIVSNNAHRVGCGYAECEGSKYTRYFVCDYAVGQSNASHPYTEGAQCSACPNTCKKGVCDCGGKLCLNHGKLDLNTCQCKCSADIFTGDTCSVLNCPKKDPPQWGCGTRIPQSWCKTYVNIPSVCPVMCGLCEAGTEQTGVGQPTCEDPFECQFYKQQFCDVYSNVRGLCPKLCGDC